MPERRQAARARILAQIEAQDDSTTVMGQVLNISTSGLLVATSETLFVDVIVIVRFFLPGGGEALQAAGRVVRAELGKSMAIAFLRIRERDRHRIADYVGSIQKAFTQVPPVEEGEGNPWERRSARFPRRIPLLVSWEDSERRPRQEAIETQNLSRHGARVQSFIEFEPGQLLWVTVPETGKRAVAQVVWVKPSLVAAQVDMGLEILGTDQFWGIEFSPYRPPKNKPTRPRGIHVAHCIPVVLIWTDEWGRLREEKAETRLVRRHGAVISTLAVVPSDQPLRLRVPEVGREAEVEIIGVLASETPGWTELEIEFVEAEDFWGIAFPPAAGSGTT